MIAPCSCNHEYQDKKYGPGKRVHNKKANGQQTCTVCGRVSGTPTGTSSPVKKKK